MNTVPRRCQNSTSKSMSHHSHQQRQLPRRVLLGRIAFVVQRPIVVKLSRGLSVSLYVCASVGRSVCPVHCGKAADRIRQPFGTIGRTGPRMRQVLGFANRSTGRGTFGGEFGARHCNQWGLYGVRVRQSRNDPIPKPHYLSHPWTRPTYDTKRHPDLIRRFSTIHWTDRRMHRPTDGPTDRPRESLMTIDRCAPRALQFAVGSGVRQGSCLSAAIFNAL